jgi:hypothetical protein
MAVAPLVLHADVDHDQIDDAALANGLQLINVRGASGSHPAQLVYAAPGEVAPEAYLQVVEDGRLGVVYLCAEGQAAEGVLRQMEASLPCHQRAECGALLAEVELERVRRGLALWALAGSKAGVAVEPEPEALIGMRALLVSEDRARRAALLTALAYHPVAALRADLERLRDGDDDAMRLHASQLLQVMGP